MTTTDMYRLINIQVLDHYLMHLEFSDGYNVTVDLSPLLGQGITAELLDYENFKRVHIEHGGGLEWYNGFDLCPNALSDLQSADS